jgi:glutamate dehydrogenase/leucine dehydrogenase
MEFFDTMALGGHEQLIAIQDDESGLRAWLALHHTRRGPAYGGIRIWSYRNDAEAALDALRLAQTMTYKCVLAGVQGGGGKTVVLVDSLRNRRDALHELGRRIEALNGIYRSGPDAGFDENDLRHLSETTQYVAPFRTGELRPAAEATSEGAMAGIHAALKHTGKANFEGVRIAIQGLGAVGLALARRLIEQGAEVIGADPKAAACEHARKLGVKLVDPAQILRLDVDVLAPCALGGVLHELSIQRLHCRIIAGVANNVLASASLAGVLHARGILLIPDFVLNAGALIEGAGFELTGQTEWSKEVQAIGETVAALLDTAEKAGVTTVAAATAMAKGILADEATARR